MDIELIGKDILDCAYAIHSRFGSGLLEKAYRIILASELRRLGHNVDEERVFGFIYNGKNSSNIALELINRNNDLLLIDSTLGMEYTYGVEELWLDPNNLLTIANNIKNGFNEYIKANYLINKIDENYTNLKFELTSLDGKFYSTVKNSEYDYIIVDDDAFKFLEKYGLTVISLDKDTVKEKDIYTAKELLNDGDCSYIFTVYGNEKSDTIDEILTSTGKTNLELYTMTDLSELNIEKNNYITLMNDNLNQLKQELYK
jgi:ABC-type Zn uptake system ZnuABC Zn-binding protein ZnuA